MMILPGYSFRLAHIYTGECTAGTSAKGDLTQCRRFDNLHASPVHKTRKVPDATRDNCFRDIGFGVADFGDGPAT
jgi:hypothetical protein